MIAIAIRFLAGRYHATPWNRHVNEGAVEWPPAPWRILRALVAASYKLPDLPRERVRRALEPLRGLPSYWIPPCEFSHVRHYMPQKGHRRGLSKETAPIFDAFAAPGRDEELIVVWNDADPIDPETLDRLLAAIGYLGRAESWIEARRLPAWSGETNAYPTSGDAGSGDRLGERIELLALPEDATYVAWLAKQESAPKPRKKLRPLPADWWELLHLDTSWIDREAWSAPPGVRFVSYTHHPATARPRHRPPSSSMQFSLARYEITSRVLPPVRLTLPVAERLRQALMSRASDHEIALQALSGRTPSGDLLQGHQHAHFLPIDEDGDEKLDHALVWARTPFPSHAKPIFAGLRRLWGSGGHDLHLALVSSKPSEFPQIHPQLGPARVWESLTPFIPVRHTKVRGGKIVDAPEAQVAELLEELGIQGLKTIERIPRPRRDFVTRRRSGGGSRAGDRSYFFRLEFSESVRGPIAVGYGSHFGLGQFCVSTEGVRAPQSLS